VIITGLGVAVSVAWSVRFVPLIQAFPNLPPLTRQGAMFLLLSGAALAFLSGGWKRLSAICAKVSLSKTIAEDHGGRLEYSQDNGHTCFSLVLPVARKAEAA
jgi:hypothetical protein